jgi:hypothetical protein
MKTIIAAASINHRFRRQCSPLPPSTMNNDRWLLSVVLVNCLTAAMAIVDGGDM